MTVHRRPYVKDGIELDQIAVQGIRVMGNHGVLQTEREGGQVFFADVVVHVNSRTAAARDSVSHTVNYSDLADRAAEVLAGSPKQLIEAVAEQISRAVLDMDGVECVDVTVHKPHAPLHVEFQDVTVTIRRDRSDGGLWADKRIGSSAGQSDDPLHGGTPPARDMMDARPAQPTPAVIALGGNLGNVELTFREALTELHHVPGIEVQNASPLVRTTPEGVTGDQPDFLNAVVRVHTTLSARELLAACHGIEMVHGRDRTASGAARTLDLDLISVDGVEGTTRDLTLPHPRAHVRGFVLLPWSHMEPDAELRPHGRVVDLARQASLDTVRMVGPQWPHVPAPDALAGPRVLTPVDQRVATTADQSAAAGETPSLRDGLSTDSGASDRLSPEPRPRDGLSTEPPMPAWAPVTQAQVEQSPTDPASRPASPDPVSHDSVSHDPVSPNAVPNDSVVNNSVPSFSVSPEQSTSPGPPASPQQVEPPAHRPDATSAQKQVPRRTSFGVMRQRSEPVTPPEGSPDHSPDEPR